ncbi:hypothetical protein PHYBLDRAFT_162792 [Phycomyces blakesleeanus NRRL 1555(-)]|uniref:Uncharacterized protein n=1 Tax=Phycomyces blakesleeanus (strain ATCC 8743b / DSM 1359 / FGSC 10004 / NBRC 33097 / NRRL 1555) TaxID=763407 RepID=A0A167QI94_PHYB8|nr:hypothetical protein PHYBLDRAFT_162792 [Phycomyces blakesleeanus NRRL 1555(-)]OAD79734.1 hypothetical protein PHYBLDRAFT_162792 [Phycomyces blakesleeanus NRRL 1555(-)]|eukprot:XP_018297774.1 hypothetical protein PHYBLDRAFT_162792 [Phycomyces blakesleeanus NRRL 1555(-)]
MKFSSFIHQLKADKHLGKDIRKRFENPAILILGNWPPKQNKYHELIKGIGTRRMLAKEGFEVYLIDKFKTSSLWPACQNGEIKSFKLAFIKIAEQLQSRAMLLLRKYCCGNIHFHYISHNVTIILQLPDGISDFVNRKQ